MERHSFDIFSIKRGPLSDEIMPALESGDLVRGCFSSSEGTLAAMRAETRLFFAPPPSSDVMEGILLLLPKSSETADSSLPFLGPAVVVVVSAGPPIARL